MKKKTVKGLGKVTKRNIESNKILKKIYQKNGINKCELKFNGCMYSWGLGFAHLHKRIWYLKHPELLSDFNQTLLTCTNCHMMIENDRKLTEKVFKKLRKK